jgi:hypothetical protein
MLRPAVCRYLVIARSQPSPANSSDNRRLGNVSYLIVFGHLEEHNNQRPSSFSSFSKKIFFLKKGG